MNPYANPLEWPIPTYIDHIKAQTLMLISAMPGT